jgi:hypothetical protein
MVWLTFALDPLTVTLPCLVGNTELDFCSLSFAASWILNGLNEYRNIEDVSDSLQPNPPAPLYHWHLR